MRWPGVEGDLGSCQGVLVLLWRLPVDSGKPLLGLRPTL